jgi:hypothetical protein
MESKRLLAHATPDHSLFARGYEDLADQICSPTWLAEVRGRPVSFGTGSSSALAQMGAFGSRPGAGTHGDFETTEGSLSVARSAETQPSRGPSLKQTCRLDLARVSRAYRNVCALPRRYPEGFFHFSLSAKYWSGRRDSNPRPRPWQGSYSLRYVPVRHGLFRLCDLHCPRIAQTHFSFAIARVRCAALTVA